MKFKDKLKSNKFLITAELYPPKGTDVSSFLRRASILSKLDAINVTDNQRASMRAGSLAMCKVLLDNGVEPIFQITTRDRNRIALQSDLLSANILGIENILIISGDHPVCGENPKAKAVYDLDTIQLIKTAKILETGVDLVKKKLTGVPAFCVGAVTNPSVESGDLQALMMLKKVLAGAEFFQTQVIFEAEKYKNFYNKIKLFAQEYKVKISNIKILTGIMLIKSPKFMDFLQNLPGINIPKEIRRRIETATNPLNEGIKICAETIKELRSFANGVHIMAIGMEEYIPEIIKQALY
jgi:5,10-methylenetetrahydrofolate reductase